MATKNTPGFGIEYEILVPAYLALKLNNKRVENFSIQSNVDNLGNMDDVVVNVTKNEKQFSFAMQLKHKNKKDKVLSPGSFEAEKGDFSLKKYCQAFKSLSEENKQRQFILYTNAKFDPKRTEEVTNFAMVEGSSFDGNKFLDSSSSKGNVYRFEVKDKTPHNNEITKSDYEMFLSRFTVFVCQKNYEDIEEDMVKILQSRNIVLKYLDLFRKWHQGRFTNKTIDKATVNIHLIDIFASPFAIVNRHFPVGQHDKLKLFVKVIKEFQITLINDLFKNFVKHLVRDCDLEGLEEKCEIYKKIYKMDPNSSVDECIMRLAKESKMIEKSVTKLETEEKFKIFHYFFEKPLIVNFNKISQNFIYKIMELHQLRSKVKFVLVGQGIRAAKLKRLRMFKNLNDLLVNETLYKDVIRTCRLSLQGRKEITLEKLIHSSQEILGYTGAKEVFHMLKDNFLVGQKAERLPPYYIDRKVSLKVLTSDTVFHHTFLKENLVVIDFNGKLEEIRNKIRKLDINVIDIHDYLKSKKIVKGSVTIISTNEECSGQLLEDVSEKSNKKSVLFLRRMCDDGSLSVVTSRNCSTKKFIWKKISIEENKIYDYLTRPINVLCANPGMGKSSMLNKLKNECHSEFWTIRIDLKTHNEFLKKQHDTDEFLSNLFRKSEDCFSDNIRDDFRSKKNVVFFFDGVDEVENQCVDDVLKYIKELSSMGFRVWVSSRNNLKEKLELRLEPFTLDMEEVDKEQQKCYIKNRLKEKYLDEEIEKMMDRIFSSTDIVNNCRVLGIPLQLYIITQTFLDHKEVYHSMTDNIFVLTKMYKLFFSGKIKHNLDKLEYKHSHVNPVKPEEVLKRYEVLALQSLFDNHVLKMLDLEIKPDKEFLYEIKRNKDFYGIVTNVDEKGKAVFGHLTFAEYFVAQFFANNHDKARIIRNQLLSDRYKNVMMIFNVILAEDNPLHLGVIYQDENQIVKHIEDKNIHDKGGRNPLHIATYNEPRFASHSIRFSPKIEEYLKNIRILEIIVDHFDYNECDELFKLSALDYAFENNSLLSAEIILKKYKGSKEVLKYVKNYKYNPKFYFFCLAHGYKNVLSLLIANSKNSKMILKSEPWMFIKYTIVNCYYEESETLGYLIDFFFNSDRFCKINKGYKVKGMNRHLEAALCLAATNGKTYAIQLLIEEGTCVNVVTKNNKTPLHLALENGRTETVKLLIDNGASIDAVTTDNKSALDFAVENGETKTAKLLIEKGASVNNFKKYDETLLHSAVKYGKSKMVKLLIEEGAAVDAVTFDNETPLHWAAKYGRTDAVKFLTAGGACVNAVRQHNETPLHLAVKYEKLETAKLLIEEGASVNAGTKFNEAPLHLAVKNGKLEMVMFLIDAGASVNTVLSDTCKSPLHLAAQDGKTGIADILIENGAFVNAVTNNNETPLHLALKNATLETAQLLIERGACVNAVMNDNATPLHLAVYAGNEKFVSFLLSKSVDLAAIEINHEEYPLRFAARLGCLKKDLLLEVTRRQRYQKEFDIYGA
jgi:ankyrin repeat protein